MVICCATTLQQPLYGATGWMDAAVPAITVVTLIIYGQALLLVAAYITPLLCKEFLAQGTTMPLRPFRCAVFLDLTVKQHPILSKLYNLLQHRHRKYMANTICQNLHIPLI